MSPTTKQRDPPPSLFLGPPSQNTSHVTLPDILHPSTTLIPHQNTIAPLPSHPNPTSLHPSTAHPSHHRTPSTKPNNSDTAPGSSLPRTALPHQQQATETQKQADHTDALWAEMQSTLEEVELSASSGAHVFGVGHGRALEGLREAQIGLARAWARRGEGDEEEGGEDEREVGGVGVVDREGEKGGRPGSSGGEKGKEKEKEKEKERAKEKEKEKGRGKALDEETAADIALARKRREANDRYFGKVNAGVVDVVAKLEEVAAAMRAVERESRDIWGDTDSLEE